MYLTETQQTSIESEHLETNPSEQFAGLLHGSSPACEPPENPFQLYTKASPVEELSHEISLNRSYFQATELQQENNTDPPVKKKKPPILNRTVFLSKGNVGETNTLAGITRTGEQWVANAAGFVERACTLGRIRSLPKTLLDMHLSKYVSKSDSNLISYPPTEQKGRRNWSESTADPESSRANSERTPSFTSEWEEVSFFIFYYKGAYMKTKSLQETRAWNQNPGYCTFYETHAHTYELAALN